MEAGKSPTPTVLVVDDEPLIRWSLSEGLSRAGYRVVQAQDRKRTLDHFQHRPSEVGVVLLDLRLPDSHDLDLLGTLRRLAPSCQIILITAHGTPELMEEAVRQGAYRVVEKPFDVDEIVTLVEGALRQPQP